MRPGSRRRLRWLLIAGACLAMAVLYYRPVRAYIETSDELARRSGEVRKLVAQRARLEGRVQVTERGATLLEQARRLGLVEPGERLFIVKGIAAWRRARAAAGSR